ncbi:hypothetical protein [Agromyces aureus]|uniref:Uncharacterized protein n=1 Tax=Agromyces aureus TaxID=453304 RepID=A0A191WJP4_9MICO|nr:hypothetical protein [Agromyces aureus]ANJ28437.1 hypothetical protein ATC03_18805 [Agromyces aureus]
MSDDSVDPAAAGEQATEPHLLGPGLLPTPFTAGEIRAASGSGKRIRLLVEMPGGERFERVNRFVDLDDEGATLEQWRLDAAGEPDGEVTSERVTWRELQEHAAFPAEATARTSVVLASPLGTLDCLRYEVRHGEGDDASIMTFWFALAHPGMPVRYEIPTPGGLMRTTMLAVDLER